MTITVNRASLAKAMTSLARTVERRNTIPILSHVRMSIDGEALALTANNLDMEASTTLACSNPAGLVKSFTTPAHMLESILRKMPDGDVTLAQEEGQAKSLIVKQGRSRFQLPTLPSEDFPTLEAGELPVRFQMTGSELLAAIKPISFAISKEETRYYLNGVHLHRKGDLLVFVATDGHRLARSTVPLPEGAGDIPPIIIPRAAVAEIARMAEGQDAPLHLAASASKVHVAAGATTFISKLIDGTFPDYERVIPQANGKIATLKREALEEAVDRVATIASDKSRAAAFDFAPERLAISMKNPDMGTAEDEIEAAYGDETVTIGFNADYVIDLLRVLEGEEVVIALNDPGSPTVITSAAQPALTIVLMPMRL